MTKSGKVNQGLKLKGWRDSIINKLTREQWYELDEQMSYTPSETEADGVPGEHLKLLALLNKFELKPMSKDAALVLVEKLLDEGSEDTKSLFLAYWKEFDRRPRLELYEYPCS